MDVQGESLRMKLMSEKKEAQVEEKYPQQNASFCGGWAKTFLIYSSATLFLRLYQFSTIFYVINSTVIRFSFPSSKSDIYQEYKTPWRTSLHVVQRIFI